MDGDTALDRSAGEGGVALTRAGLSDAEARECE